MLSFNTIATRVVVEARLADSGISPDYVFNAWLRSRYRQIIDQLQFSDLNRQGTIAFATSAPYADGVVNVTNGSPVVMGIGTNFINAQQGWFFRINNQSTWYEVESITNATELVLDTPFTELTLANASYLIAQRYYTMPTGVRWITDIKLPQRYLLFEVDQAKLDELFPVRLAAPSIPQYWAPYGWNAATRRRTLEFYPIADKQYRLEVVGYANVDEPQLDASPVGDINDRILIEGGLAEAMKYRAAAPGLPAAEVQAMLLLYGSHEKQFDILLRDMLRRSALDKPQPKIEVMIGDTKRPWGVHDYIMTAEDEVWSRPPL